MKNTIKVLGLALMSLSLVFTSCKKEEEPKDTKGDTITVSLATKNNETPNVWVYYSFDSKAEVSGVNEDNYLTSDAWDIAFHSRHIRLNGGTSGEGMAAAYDAGKVEFVSVKTANESGYTEDKLVEDAIYAGNGAQGPIYEDSNMNSVFENAFSFDQNTHPPTYEANMNIYVFKTRTGKYAKIILEDYYNQTGESGYITFKYLINKDGLRSLE